MVINDTKSMYTIKFDSSRNISYEKNVGLWSKEDYLRYTDEYLNKIGPLLGGKPWAKYVDLREYKTSDISDVMAKHVEWMEKTKCTTVAMIVDSAIVKMQINRAVGGKLSQMAFTDEKEADEWLKTKGF